VSEKRFLYFEYAEEAERESNVEFYAGSASGGVKPLMPVSSRP
jgi:hypothetical protein